MKKLLQAEHGWTDAEEQTIYDAVAAQVEDAVRFAMQSPPMQVEDMGRNLFEEGSV